MQKKIKKNPPTATANACARNKREEKILTIDINLEDESQDDDLSCAVCPHREACKLGKIERCVVKDSTAQDVDWFIPFWNKLRLEHHARLKELLFLTNRQKGMLRRRQARYGQDALRLFVQNLMTSDFVNARLGKRSPSNLDHYLECHRFPTVVQGRYNDLEPEAPEPTAEEQRQLEMEKRQREQEQRRAEALRIEEEDREAQRRQREYDAAHAARGKELQAIFDKLDKQMAEYGGGRDLEKNIKNTACEG